MESTPILLRYFVNAANERKGRERWSTRLECPTTKNIMSLGQRTSHEIFLCPPRSATLSPDLQNFIYASSFPRLVASNNAKRHIMEYRAYEDAHMRMSDNRQCNRKLI